MVGTRLPPIVVVSAAKPTEKEKSGAGKKINNSSVKTLLYKAFKRKCYRLATPRVHEKQGGKAYENSYRTYSNNEDERTTDHV